VEAHRHKRNVDRRKELKVSETAAEVTTYIWGCIKNFPDRVE